MQPKVIMAANWKMNMINSEAIAFAKDFRKKIEGKTGEVKIVVCAPFTALESLVREFKGSEISVGAQNMYFEEKGAYTGEISSSMLCDLGIEYVIIGHSERRQYFGETDELVNKKTKTALKNGLAPIICVGETIEERQKGITEDKIANQLRAAFDGITAEHAAKCVIAYEPLWAIGTGIAATPEVANGMCGIIREELTKMYSADCANCITIQYGGSMSSQNSKELLDQWYINGGLIGGAGLIVDEFVETVMGAV